MRMHCGKYSTTSDRPGGRHGPALVAVSRSAGVSCARAGRIRWRANPAAAVDSFSRCRSRQLTSTRKGPPRSGRRSDASASAGDGCPLGDTAKPRQRSRGLLANSVSCSKTSAALLFQDFFPSPQLQVHHSKTARAGASVALGAAKSLPPFQNLRAVALVVAEREPAERGLSTKYHTTSLGTDGCSFTANPWRPGYAPLAGPAVIATHGQPTPSSSGEQKPARAPEATPGRCQHALACEPTATPRRNPRPRRSDPPQ